MFLSTAATSGSIAHPADDISVWRATVSDIDRKKSKELGEKPVPVLLCPP
jgi:hypothetical protein